MGRVELELDMPRGGRRCNWVMGRPKGVSRSSELSTAIDSVVGGGGEEQDQEEFSRQDEVLLLLAAFFFARESGCLDNLLGWHPAMVTCAQLLSAPCDALVELAAGDWACSYPAGRRSWLGGANRRGPVGNGLPGGLLVRRALAKAQSPLGRLSSLAGAGVTTNKSRAWSRSCRGSRSR